MRAPRLAAAVALLGVGVLAALGPGPVAGATGGLTALVGAGILGRLGCIGCVAALTMLAAGATPLAVLAVMAANPEASAACLAACFIAART